MHRREYPVLPDDDALLAEFGVCLGADAARVLAYLVRRRESGRIDRPEATRLEIRVGTGLGRAATVDALSTLESLDLVTTTTVARERRGRPPKGWGAADTDDPRDRRLRAHHARRLLTHAAAMAPAFGASLPEEPAPDSIDVPGDPVDDLTMALNWQANGLHGPLLAAADLGIYGTHGLDIGFEPSRGSGAALDRLGGDADLAVVGAASLCRATGALVPLCLLYQRSMAVLYTTDERLGSSFTSVEQLRGRRLAVTPDSEVGRLARLFLAHAGVLDDVETVAVAGDERAALERGEADVATGMPIDPHELATAGHGVTSLPVADHFPAPGPAVVTTAALAAESPATVARFLMGTLAGVTAARRDPERMARHVAERSDDDPESERWRFENADTRSTAAAADEHGWGWQTHDAWDRLRVALRQEATG